MVIGLARPSDITPGYGELTVGRQMRKRLDEVRLYRDPNFAELATDCRDGLQVTRIDRTLLDIGANHDLSLFRMCFNGAIRQRLITHAAFVEAAGNDKRRRGRRQLEQAVAAVDGEVVTPSDWSQLATERLVAAGLPRPQLETLLCDRAGRTIGRVDMYWPEFAVVVELDGRAFHLNPRSFESDRQRDARLAGVGITVLRFTWSQYQDGDYFERTIADVLQHRD